MLRAGEPLPTSGDEQILAAKISRAMLSGPFHITRDATVADMDAQGNVVVLRQGTNQWVCFPGDENEIGNVPMCADPMGLQWMIIWPYDAARDGLPNTVRDAGAWVMFDGTPYAYLHICGTPWSGNEYTPGQVPVWTMRYRVPTEPPMAAASTTPE
jgi:hypothetical protein